MSWLLSPAATTIDLGDLQNVTITANTAGELLKWNGSAWVNNTLAEANLAGLSDDSVITGDWTITNNQPKLYFQEDDQAADEGNWIFKVTNGDFKISTATDAAPTVTVNTPFSLIRGTGTAPSIARFENLSTGVQIRDGAYLRIMDSGDTDYVTAKHDGTNFNWDYVNTAFSINTGATMHWFDAEQDAATVIRAGPTSAGSGNSADARLELFAEQGSTIYGLNLSVISSNAYLNGVTTSGATAATILNSNLHTYYKDGRNVRIYDSGNTDYVNMSHDGTDFTIAATTTTDLNITGITDLVAVNYTFNVAETVGAGQDNYVLTYDDGTGKIGLEAAPGAAGGDAWGDVVDAVITPDADGTRDLGLTGTRFAEGFFDDLDVTNVPTIAGVTQNAAFVVEDNTGGQTLSTTALTVNLDNVLVAHSNYSVATDIITIATAGTYLCTYQCTWDMSPNTALARGGVETWIEVNPASGGYALVPQLQNHEYFRELARNQTGTGSSVVVIANDGDLMRLQVKLTTGTAADPLVVNMSNVTLVKLA